MAIPGTNLLFYAPTDGVGEFLQVNPANKTIRKIGHQDGWRSSWSVIRAISNPPDAQHSAAGLLFYDRSEGTLQLYRIEDHIHIQSTLLLEGWRPGWTDIVVTDTGFLCYDRGAGVVELYQIALEGGGITLAGRQTGWRTSWDIIRSYEFPGTPRYLFCYDSAAAIGEIYTVSKGQLNLTSKNTELPHTWTQVIDGYFGVNPRVGLLGYSPSLGQGNFYDVSTGAMTHISTDTGWRSSWNQIVPAYYGGHSSTGLLFYDAAAGLAEVYDFVNGTLSLLSSYPGWRTTWANILAYEYVAI